MSRFSISFLILSFVPLALIHSCSEEEVIEEEITEAAIEVPLYDCEQQNIQPS